MADDARVLDEIAGLRGEIASFRDDTQKSMTAFREDVCTHLHRIEDDTGKMKESTETELRRINERLDDTASKVAQATAHDSLHEQAVAKEIQAEAEKRAAAEAQLVKQEKAINELTSQVGSLTGEVKTLDSKVVAVVDETKAQTESLKNLTASVANVVGMVEDVYKSGKKLAANPQLRAAVVVVLSSIGSTGGMLALLKGCQPAVLPAETPVLAVPIARTVATPAGVPPDLTAYERDVVACGSSVACEESVRARYGRAVTAPTSPAPTTHDAGVHR